jgi:outer membrane protein assembly factor BamA
VLATREAPWLPWRDRTRFDPQGLELDLRRIVAYYRDQGFAEARVVSHEVQVDDAHHEVDVTVRVYEGEPTRIVDVELEGFDVLSAEEIASLRGCLPAAGARAVVAAMRAGVEVAAAALKDNGYAHARVFLHEETIDLKRLRLRYVAAPGQRAVFGRVEIVGNASVGDNIVRRQLTYRPGEVFSLAEVRAAQRQLYGLELFQFATIDTQEDGELERVPTRVTVAEGDQACSGCTSPYASGTASAKIRRDDTSTPFNRRRIAGHVERDHVRGTRRGAAI